jgi:hypothetical protein
MVKKRSKKLDFPIEHWSYSSLMSYLRNPLAWHKRYVENIRDTPSKPSGVVGRAGHKALEHFYSSVPKEHAIEQGLKYLRDIPDFEIDFGKATTKAAQKKKRALMEREYLQAIGFYLERPPRHKVVGVEIAGLAPVEDLPLPVKAISDLVVESRIEKGALDIVDHKFVDSFSALKGDKTLFVLQALFNYYTVKEAYGLPVRRFIVQECKKRKNKDGKSQMRRYIIDFAELEEEFGVFYRLLFDATLDLATRKIFLPNPSDMFEGENSFDIYRLGL